MLISLAMATVHELRPRTDRDPSSGDGAQSESLLSRLLTLAKLELELGLAETRDVLISAAIAIAVAIPAAVLLVSSLVVLVAAAFAPLFGAPWQHLLIAGGGMALLAIGAIAWSAWRLTHLKWPRETVASFQENWRWLVAQLKSKLTLR